MTWKLTKAAEGLEPIPGIRWADYSDEEFTALAKEYSARNQFPAKALADSGYWQHTEDKPSDKKEG